MAGGTRFVADIYEARGDLDHAAIVRSSSVSSRITSIDEKEVRSIQTAVAREMGSILALTPWNPAAVATSPSSRATD